MALGCEAWESSVTANTTTEESKEYNTKAIKTILSSLSDSIKVKVGQCSSANSLWENYKNFMENLALCLLNQN